MCARRLRFGSIDLAYASGDEKSRFQNRSRFLAAVAISRSRKRSTPATSSEAMSPSFVSGLVPGRNFGGPFGVSASTEQITQSAATAANGDVLPVMTHPGLATGRE